MKKLIITAHPSSRGFTHKIAENYKQGSEDAGHEVEILDLYKDNFKQDFFSFEDARKIPYSETREEMQERIKKADEIIFIFPIWWGTCPAVMKNFFDNNFTSGFAYQASTEGVKSLLKGRTARIFATCDGPSFLYTFFLSPAKITWKYFMLAFCGIKLKSFAVFGRMFKTGDQKRNKWLKKIYEMGKK